MKTELLKQLLTQAYIAGFESSGDNYNGCYPYDISELDETTKSDWLRDMERYVSKEVNNNRHLLSSSEYPDFLEVSQPKQQPKQKAKALRLADALQALQPRNRLIEVQVADELRRLYAEVDELKASKKQPKQEPVAWRLKDKYGYWVTCYEKGQADSYIKIGWELIDVLYTSPQPQQQQQPEPVAWRTFDGEGGYEFRDYNMNERYADEWAKRNPNHKHWVEPLYTTQPQPQPQQEPVAWADECRNSLVTAIYSLASDFENAIGAFGNDAEARKQIEGSLTHARRVASRWDWNGVAHPAPPQRKPLTDDQIKTAANSVRWSQQYHIDFARAIEAAHDIKVKHDQR